MFKIIMFTSVQPTQYLSAFSIERISPKKGLISLRHRKKTHDLFVYGMHDGTTFCVPSEKTTTIPGCMKIVISNFISHLSHRKPDSCLKSLSLPQVVVVFSLSCRKSVTLSLNSKQASNYVIHTVIKSCARRPCFSLTSYSCTPWHVVFVCKPCKIRIFW